MAGIFHSGTTNALDSNKRDPFSLEEEKPRFSCRQTELKVCVFVKVCVLERKKEVERERKRGRKMVCVRERKRQTNRERVCVSE